MTKQKTPSESGGNTKHMRAAMKQYGTQWPNLRWLLGGFKTDSKRWEEVQWVLEPSNFGNSRYVNMEAIFKRGVASGFIKNPVFSSGGLVTCQVDIRKMARHFRNKMHLALCSIKETQLLEDRETRHFERWYAL